MKTLKEGITPNLIYCCLHFRSEIAQGQKTSYTFPGSLYSNFLQEWRPEELRQIHSPEGEGKRYAFIPCKYKRVWISSSEQF